MANLQVWLLVRDEAESRNVGESFAYSCELVDPQWRRSERPTAGSGRIERADSASPSSRIASLAFVAVASARACRRVTACARAGVDRRVSRPSRDRRRAHHVRGAAAPPPDAPF
ncbi:hypothetical protein A8H32_32005 [Burkholderia thailandensis]|nr:hypothetical protein A8H32_32005 [Burkholderia thailandensis]